MSEETQGVLQCGELDEEGTEALLDLLDMARDMGAEIGPGEMMSRAIRLYCAVCNGGMTLTPSPELAELMKFPGVSRPH